MMFQTDVFFNFVENNYFLFKEQDGVSLAQGYELYKQYCTESLIDFKLPRYKFREEMKAYFKCFDEVKRVENKQVRSYYSGFIKNKFKNTTEKMEEPPIALTLENKSSIFDKIAANYPAQYASDNGTPTFKWDRNNFKKELH